MAPSPQPTNFEIIAMSVRIEVSASVRKWVKAPRSRCSPMPARKNGVRSSEIACDRVWFDITLAPKAHCRPAENKRQLRLVTRQGGRTPNLNEVSGTHFETHAEEKKHNPEIGECIQDLVRGRPTQNTRSDQHASQYFAHNTGLFKLSNSSARSFAVPKTASIATAIFAG
jgi:hypothetical protein